VAGVTPGPITILVAALGGQGGGVLAEWLVAAASRAGHVAQSTSIPGVAQRTGATTYYAEIHPEPATSQGRRPVLSLLPVPGAIDLVVASELLEAARMAAAGMPSPARTTVIASTSRTLTTAEKMAVGDGRFDSDRLLHVLSQQSRRLVTFDMDAVARDAGTVVSAVMLGAIAASGLLPFARDACEAAIRDVGIGVEASLSGYAAGVEAVRAPERVPPSGRATDAIDDVAAASRQAAQAFPEPARHIVALGHARLVDYQDERYASAYLERLRSVAAAEAAADPRGGHGHALLRETARFLALWMAFDDIARVAEQKRAPGRFVRVRRDAGAADGDVVRVVDYFKPGMPEIAGSLPGSIARHLVAWDARRQRRGRPPFAVAVRLRSDGIAGHCALRVLAALRRLRPRSARFRDEQRAIAAWLDATVAGAREDWSVAWEIALCGRLVKGYGATNERGKRNLAHILLHLAAPTAAFPSPGERARAIAAAREAALTDEGGMALDRALAAHGAPPRPATARPVVWHRNANGRRQGR
jgi:indolepyruvate ferredoxin oxidoreductase beta subunit